MDDKTLDILAGFICGDYEPLYRSGPDLTKFFQRAGFRDIVHDGTSRRPWTLNVLRGMGPDDLNAVILRLGNPLEYNAEMEFTAKAVERLNEILAIEGVQVVFEGAKPKLVDVEPHMHEASGAAEFAPIPLPDFATLPIEPALGAVLSVRWEEAQQCVNAGAHTMATIAMGSLLEGLLMAALQHAPAAANHAKCAPMDADGKVRKFADWTLSQMIDVAHELGWIDQDIKKFSHSLRDFRNFIHPQEQAASGAWPDEGTSAISWQVVQAAAKDLTDWFDGA